MRNSAYCQQRVLWGGRPRPRPTPWSAPLLADEGVRRGPGGPPHQRESTSENRSMSWCCGLDPFGCVRQDGARKGQARHWRGLDVVGREESRLHRECHRPGRLLARRRSQKTLEPAAGRRLFSHCRRRRCSLHRISPRLEGCHHRARCRYRKDPLGIRVRKSIYELRFRRKWGPGLMPCRRCLATACSPPAAPARSIPWTRRRAGPYGRTTYTASSVGPNCNLVTRVMACRIKTR